MYTQNCPVSQTKMSANMNYIPIRQTYFLLAKCTGIHYIPRTVIMIFIVIINTYEFGNILHPVTLMISVNHFSLKCVPSPAA